MIFVNPAGLALRITRLLLGQYRGAVKNTGTVSQEAWQATICPKGRMKMMIKKYRKKPVVVEAVQWTGKNHVEMCEFIDWEVLEIRPKEGLIIHTLEGDHHASPGDYIIKGVNGEFYPCKPDIFSKTYESEADTPQLQWISVEDRLPEDEAPVLAYYGFFRDNDVLGVCFFGTLTFFVFDKNPHWQHESTGLFVTHWMPLPEPPK